MIKANDPLLLLWDIDHTLMDITEFRTRLYGRVLVGLTGVPFRGVVSTPGLNTAEKVRKTLLAHGVVPTSALMHDFLRALVDGYRSRVNLVREGRLMPGAFSALERYSAWGCVIQSVITGNIRAIARIKLDAFGLTAFIDPRCSSFGDRTFDRSLLIRSAHRRFCQIVGTQVSVRNVMVMADTRHDMLAANRVGAGAIGIATGKYSMDELLGSGAHQVLPDLMDVTALDRVIHHLHPSRNHHG